MILKCLHTKYSSVTKRKTMPLQAENQRCHADTNTTRWSKSTSPVTGLVNTMCSIMGQTENIEASRPVTEHEETVIDSACRSSSWTYSCWGHGRQERNEGSSQSGGHKKTWQLNRMCVPWWDPGPEPKGGAAGQLAKRGQGLWIGEKGFIDANDLPKRECSSYLGVHLIRGNVSGKRESYT